MAKKEEKTPAKTPTKEVESKETQVEKSSTSNVITIVLAVLLVLSVGGVFYLFFESQNLNEELDAADMKIAAFGVKERSINAELQSCLDAMDKDDAEDEMSRLDVESVEAYYEGILLEDFAVMGDYVVVEEGTFKLDDEEVSVLYVNDSSDAFSYGVYLEDSTNYADEVIGEVYTWYLYPLGPEGEPFEISGMAFESEDGEDTEVTVVHGWLSDDQLVVSDSDTLSYGFAAVYSVSEGEFTPMSDEEFTEFLGE